jgi:uncharacterized protein
MTFDLPPGAAAWRHRDARDGFEVVFLHSAADGCRVDGATTAVADAEAWVVRYGIDLALDWKTGSARVACRSTAGEHEVTVKTDGSGRWEINGAAAPALDGCLDVDLESSAMTNAFPVHRMQLEVGEHAEAPAAYVRAVDLTVERLEQRYVRLDDDDGRQRYQYSAPRFGFECQLVYDEHGLVLDYPGIAVRAG